MVAATHAVRTHTQIITVPWCAVLTQQWHTHTRFCALCRIVAQTPTQTMWSVCVCVRVRFSPADTGLSHFSVGVDEQSTAALTCVHTRMCVRTPQSFPVRAHARHSCIGGNINKVYIRVCSVMWWMTHTHTHTTLRNPLAHTRIWHTRYIVLEWRIFGGATWWHCGNKNAMPVDTVHISEGGRGPSAGGLGGTNILEYIGNATLFRHCNIAGLFLMTLCVCAAHMGIVCVGITVSFCI